MLENDDRGLLELCRSILAHDEISPDQAYALAEWLNNHPPASESWPGRELVEPLQEMWANAVISPRDLRKLARLLGRVERENSRRAVPADAYRKVKLVDFARAQGKTPRLPRIAANMEIASSETDTIYRVNLRGPSCTCADWLGSKSRLSAGHIGRCCRHIFDAYAQLPRGHAGAEWLMAYLDFGRPTGAETQWKLLDPDTEPILISSANERGWASAFARDEGSYERFDYNIKDGRWAYGTTAPGAARIADEIVALSRHEVPPEKDETTPASPRVQASGSSTGFFSRVLILLVAAAALAFGFVKLKSQLDSKPSEKQRTAATSASPSWIATTMRPLQVPSAGRTLAIPAGTKLRVIARTPTELRVAYGNETLTIPISGTDLK